MNTKISNKVGLIDNLYNFYNFGKLLYIYRNRRTLLWRKTHRLNCAEELFLYFQTKTKRERQTGCQNKKPPVENLRVPDKMKENLNFHPVLFKKESVCEIFWWNSAFVSISVNSCFKNIFYVFSLISAGAALLPEQLSAAGWKRFWCL